jgi:hypothetical protein
MSIDQHNYELYILDYYEGKLDADAARELMLYLEQNPEAKEAFENYEAIMLEPDLSQQFEPKSSLKKTEIVEVGVVNELNYENYIIESVEQNLTPAEQANLKEFLIKNPQLQKTFDTYKKTVLKPDMSVVFNGKEMLKKSRIVPLYATPFRRMVLTTASVAAVLAVVLFSEIIIRSFNATEKRGNNLISAIDITKSTRYATNITKQIPQNNTHLTDYQPTNQLASENKTFADLTPSTKIITATKLELKKGTQFVPSYNNNNDALASVMLVKRSEYTDAVNSREQLLSRRTREAKDSQEPGLTNYLVKGIKNAARNSTKNQEQIANNERLGFWDIAGFGVYTYNKLTDKNLKVDRETDASGRLMSFNLEDENSTNSEKK